MHRKSTHSKWERRISAGLFLFCCFFLQSNFLASFSSQKHDGNFCLLKDKAFISKDDQSSRKRLFLFLFKQEHNRKLYDFTVSNIAIILLIFCYRFNQNICVERIFDSRLINIFGKTLIEVCSLHLDASFGTFCIQIGQLFAPQLWL